MTTNKAISGFTAMPFPEPMREAPEMARWYWAADPCVSNFCSQFVWYNEGIDNRLLERGLCHATREAAETHGRYLASLSTKTKGGL